MTAELLARAQRAFAGRSAAEVASEFRAIVGPTRSEDQLVVQALEALQNGRPPAPSELAALEFAIKVFRPSLLSKEGELPRLSAEQAAAFPTYEAYRAACAPSVRAVCRVDRGPKGSELVPLNVGTGFLVEERLLATNRHVLEELALGGHALERGMAVVHFGQEHGRTDEPDEGPVDVLRVVCVHADLDVAILEIERMPAKRAPLALATPPPEAGRHVVVVGYPYADSRNPLFVGALFANKFGVRRGAPGEIMLSGGATFDHECSTLGGNSGSPVFDMLTGEVAGIHFAGQFAGRNRAVSAAAVRALLERPR